MVILTDNCTMRRPLYTIQQYWHVSENIYIYFFKITNHKCIMCGFKKSLFMVKLKKYAFIKSVISRH